MKSTIGGISHLSYRPDIDGLRALAILAVVVFHAFPTLMPGGFIGVDVFFVISGFLISGIIFKGLERNTFSFTDFYARRIRRIFPALLLVLVTSYTIGWFILLPDEYMQLGKHIAAGAGFIQNFTLWKESGYFDIDSQLKPLLHLWSLSVEEQYYLIYPLLIWAAWRSRFNIFLVISILAILSFGLNINIVGDDPSKAFYVPFTRFWELMAGAALAAFQRPRRTSEMHNTLQHDILSVTGLLTILAAAWGIHKSDPFPGWLALAPVIGSALLIAAGPGALVNRKILANKYVVFVGLISYPLYLWHWPLLSFANILDAEQPAFHVRLTIVMLSFLLAWLTYRIVERPVRFGQFNWIRTAVLCSLMTMVGYMGYNSFERNGLNFRHAAKINSPEFYGAIKTGGKYGGFGNHVTEGCGLQRPGDGAILAHCMSDKRGNIKFALMGDSKASALAPGLFLESGEKGHWLFIGGTLQGEGHYSTVLVISNNPVYSYAQQPTRAAVDSIARNHEIKAVVITEATRALFHLANDYSLEDLPSSKYFDAAFNGLDNVIAELVKAGKKVIIMVDNPTLRDSKFCIPRTTGIRFLDRWMGLKEELTPFTISYDKHLSLTRQYRQLLDKLQARYPRQLRIFDPLDLLCDMKTRTCSSTLNGKLLYIKGDHISNYASARIARKLVPFVENFALGEHPSDNTVTLARH